jgi:pimeloyl-ACP methyl ester carboxylesterase
VYRPVRTIVQVCCLLILAAAFVLVLAVVHETLSLRRGEIALPRNECRDDLNAPGMLAVKRTGEGSFCAKRPGLSQGAGAFCFSGPETIYADAWAEPGQSGRTISAPEEASCAADEATTLLPAGNVTIVVHGVEDDGKNLSHGFKRAFTNGRSKNTRQELLLFRWTRPDGQVPSLAHARNSLKAIERKYPKCPENEAGYQVAVAERLKDFMAGVRALYREYGVDCKIDLVAHSQGTLIVLKALGLGAVVDNMVFLGSPLDYTGARQDDVVEALPHIRGVLYNYYTRSDLPIRCMGGFFLREPCGWPAKDLPREKVVQTCLNVEGHTGYYTEAAVRTNYLDKVGVVPGEERRTSARRAKKFRERWSELVKASKAIEPE